MKREWFQCDICKAQFRSDEDPWGGFVLNTNPTQFKLRRFEEKDETRPTEQHICSSPECAFESLKKWIECEREVELPEWERPPAKASRSLTRKADQMQEKD